MEQQEVECRICFGTAQEAPGGLADILIEPCSCVFRWQEQRAASLQDPDHCEVCRQPMVIPPAALQGLAGAGVITRGQQRRLGWSRLLRPVLRLGIQACKLYVRHTISSTLLSALVDAVQLLPERRESLPAQRIASLFQIAPASQLVMLYMGLRLPMQRWPKYFMGQALLWGLSEGCGSLFGTLYPASCQQALAAGHGSLADWAHWALRIPMCATALVFATLNGVLLGWARVRATPLCLVQPGLLLQNALGGYVKVAELGARSLAEVVRDFDGWLAAEDALEAFATRPAALQQLNSVLQAKPASLLP